MAFNLKSATPDASMPSTGFLFGADSQSATDPAIYALATVADAMAALRRPFSQVTSQRTLSNVATMQALFDSGSDALTVEASTTYLFDGLIHLANMSTTSGNMSFSLLGAGTATIEAVKYHVIGSDASSLGVQANQSGSFQGTETSTSNVVAAAAGALCAVTLRGIVRINGAGTLIPSIALTTAAAATVELGTYMRFERMCANSVAAVGAWG